MIFGDFPWENPNYGLEIANSIIFTDNIPLLAITFKIFKQLINQNFQCTAWVFISFFLQLFFSYLLINNITKISYTHSYQFSFSSNTFFALQNNSPFFFGRTMANFILYLRCLFCQENRKVKHWYFLIFVSSNSSIFYINDFDNIFF